VKWHRPKAILDEIARLKVSVESLQARTRDLKRAYSLFPGKREILSAAETWRAPGRAWPSGSSWTGRSWRPAIG
jgi:hypothetical protein